MSPRATGRLNWRLVLALAAFGIVMGVAAVFGLITGLEASPWLVLAVVISLIIARQVGHSQFLHGFWVGLIGGSLAPLVLVVMWATYLDNHPDLTLELAKAPDGFNPKIYLLAATPLVASLSGVTLGGLAWGAGKMLGKRLGKRRTVRAS